MSKLRNAVSKIHLKRLGQDVEPLKRDEELQGLRALRGRRRRRARVAETGESVRDTHLPANQNGAQEPTQEPQPIREARARLRTMIAAATANAPRSSVGIVLAIVNQETGNHAAANALIDEYKLAKLFGITKFCPNG